MPRIEDPIVSSILDTGRDAYVAVNAPAGPHLSPERFAVADGRLWCWTESTSPILDDDRIGAAVVGRGRSAVLWGWAERFDTAALASLPRLLRQPRAIARAALRYGRRNPRPTKPLRRVLLAITPDEAHAVDGPPAGGARDAGVAWQTKRGPRVFPCRLDRNEKRFRFRRDIPQLDRLPSPGRVGVVVEGASPRRLLRGTATLRHDGVAELVTERISFLPSTRRC